MREPKPEIPISAIAPRRRPIPAHAGWHELSQHELHRSSPNIIEDMTMTFIAMDRFSKRSAA
jgi:hypothetical protein